MAISHQFFPEVYLGRQGHPDPCLNASGVPVVVRSGLRSCGICLKLPGFWFQVLVLSLFLDSCFLSFSWLWFGLFLDSAFFPVPGLLFLTVLVLIRICLTTLQCCPLCSNPLHLSMLQSCSPGSYSGLSNHTPILTFGFWSDIISSLTSPVITFHLCDLVPVLSLCYNTVFFSTHALLSLLLAANWWPHTCGSTCSKDCTFLRELKVKTRGSLELCTIV